MSHKASIWSWDQRGLSPTDKLVLLAMADSAGHDGRSFCSNKTICEMTGLLKEDTVTEAQKRILLAGLLEDTGSRAGATGRVKVFQFPPDACQSPVSRVNPPFREPNPPPIPRLTGSALIKELVTKKEPRAVAPSSAEKCTKETTLSQARKFSDAWCKEYEDKFRGKYAFQGGRDGKAVSELVKFGTPEELIEIARKAWSQTDPQKFWSCINLSSTISKFLSGLSSIRVELSRVESSKAQKGKVCY